MDRDTLAVQRGVHATGLGDLQLQLAEAKRSPGRFDAAKDRPRRLIER